MGGHFFFSFLTGSVVADTGADLLACGKLDSLVEPQSEQFLRAAESAEHPASSPIYCEVFWIVECRVRCELSTWRARYTLYASARSWPSTTLRAFVVSAKAGKPCSSSGSRHAPDLGLAEKAQ